MRTSEIGTLASSCHVRQTNKSNRAVPFPLRGEGKGVPKVADFHQSVWSRRMVRACVFAVAGAGPNECGFVNTSG